jgi:hypothetical protein
VRVVSFPTTERIAMIPMLDRSLSIAQPSQIKEAINVGRP